MKITPTSTSWLVSRIRAFLMLGAALSAFGCMVEETPKMYEVCGDEYEDVEITRLVNGNLVIVGNYNEQGYDSAELVSSMVYSLVLNGIDFSVLADYNVSFDRSTGAYALSNGKASVGFTLYFETDFEDHAAGDFIPYNIFNDESFVENVSVSVSSDLKVNGNYDPGPLYGLVKGDVKFSAPANVEVKIDALRVAIQVQSANTYGGSWPFNEDDELTLHLSTTRLSLDSFAEQLDAGGVGFDFSGTRYLSHFFEIDQTFNDALFSIVRTDTGWTFQGEYYADMTKWGNTLYMTGFVSNVAQNTTSYYCDEERTSAIGTAFHDLELNGGVFEFENGESFRYRLLAY